MINKQKTIRLIASCIGLLALTSFPILSGGCASHQKDELGPEFSSLLGIDEKLPDTPQEDLEKTFDANTLIRRAETFYSKEEYESALVEYQRFLDLHPLHRLAQFAQLRIGLCYYHQIRTPDRDIEPIQKALATFQKIIADAPQSLYAQKAGPYIGECKKKLAAREYYVGYFYFKKESYRAAVERLNQLLKEYPESENSEDALFYLGVSYQKLGDQEKSKNYIDLLLKKDPQTIYRNQITLLFPKLSSIAQ